VEQVTTSALEGPASRYVAIPSEGITAAVEVLVFLIWQLLHWLLFGCKNSQEWPRATSLRRGIPAMLPALTGGSANRTTWAAEPLLCQIPVRVIHNRGNLACYPDFKLSHYFLGDFVVAPVPDALPSLIVRRGDASRAPLRRGLRVTVIISAVPSGGELTR
jgi:hypothetical protein